MATTLADDLKPLHHPKTWIGKYVWSQDHKVIAIQYSLTAISIGLVALVLSVLMRLQLGFPGAVTGRLRPWKTWRATVSGVLSRWMCCIRFRWGQHRIRCDCPFPCGHPSLRDNSSLDCAPPIA